MAFYKCVEATAFKVHRVVLECEIALWTETVCAKHPDTFLRPPANEVARLHRSDLALFGSPHIMFRDSVGGQ